VVTRYFGGTLLGTGGLIRAYGSAVRECLDAAAEKALIKELIQAYDIKVVITYSELAATQKVLNNAEAQDIICDYGANIDLSFKVGIDKFDNLAKSLTNLTDGRISMDTPNNTCYYLL